MSIFNFNRKFIQSQLYQLCVQRGEGFLLVELIVALLMISLFMMVIVQYQALNIQWRSNTQRRLIALDKGTYILEQLLSDNSLAKPTCYQEDGFSVQIETNTRYDFKPLMATEAKTIQSPMLILVIVTIKWKNWRQEEQIVTLETAITPERKNG